MTARHFGKVVVRPATDHTLPSVPARHCATTQAGSDDPSGGRQANDRSTKNLSFGAASLIALGTWLIIVLAATAMLEAPNRAQQVDAPLSPAVTEVRVGDANAPGDGRAGGKPAPRPSG